MKISEIFYSEQMEGPSAGIPAIFIRLTGCNFCCGGPSGKLVGDKATWWCDTEPVWRVGKDYTNEELIEVIKGFGNDVLSWVLSGRVRIVWTGGEPMMSPHQKAIGNFLSWASAHIYSEIETNGTIEAIKFYTREKNFYQDYIKQINCSPKLENSGMPAARRINKDSILQIKEEPNSFFKFVVSKEEDIKEAEETYIKPFGLPWQKIVLMPALSLLRDVPETGKFIIAMGKQYGYRSTLRGHIAVYDQTTGV
jgi:7-carboxy-7-deazaguanine synthase